MLNYTSYLAVLVSQGFPLVSTHFNDHFGILKGRSRFSFRIKLISAFYVLLTHPRVWISFNYTSSFYPPAASPPLATYALNDSFQWFVHLLNYTSERPSHFSLNIFLCQLGHERLFFRGKVSLGRASFRSEFSANLPGNTLSRRQKRGERVGQDAWASIKFLKVLKSTAWPRRGRGTAGKFN